MQIVITGASGFVGTNLMTFFNSKGMKVVPISLRSDNFTTGLPDDADVIIHLAGKAHDTSNLSGAQDYYRINRDLTIRLFNFFLSSKVKDFFYFSSVKAVADTIEGILYENVQPS